MMRKLTLVTLFILILSIVACNTKVPIETKIQDNELIEEQLLTKEEFIQLIQEYDVGVTIQDFNKVNLDEFIAHYYISKEVFNKFISGNYSLSRNLERYIENAPRRDREALLYSYLVQELEYVNSTDEKYLDFISRYFNAIGQDANQIRTEDNGVLVYGYEIEGSGYFLYGFCQTSKSKKLPISTGEKDKDKNYTIKLYSGDESYYTNIYYSKSGKYLMYLDGNGKFESYEAALDVIRTFCEMED